jgi:SAM-dependent methyltransferase
VLNRRLKSLAQRVLPRCLQNRLDPVQEIIESEVMAAAEALGEGGIALDAGAGESRHRRDFARGLYVALDAGSGDPAWDYSNLDVQGNLEDLPLGPSSVDCVLCMVVLEHTRDPRRVVAEFGRVLKPGGSLRMVVPFLWEEHQTPHDYFRFTRYGVRALFRDLPFRIDAVDPMGGFFWLSARRSVNLLGFFQKGWRWILFVLMAPLFGFLFPLILSFLDGLDKTKEFTLGFRVRATKEGG